MNKIALINVYIGKFPNYFKLWEHSAGLNPSVDFHFYCDNPIKSDYPNIFFHKTSLPEIKTNLEKLLGMEIKLNRPYKLCEYKTVYGLLFKNDLKNYTHWGYFDTDLIFGKISNFVTDEMLDKYDKIYKHGHLTIFKNNDRMNNLFKVDNHSTLYTYKEAFSTNLVCYFDEKQGISTIAENEPDVKCYFNLDFADINYKKFRFTRSETDFDYPQIYKYENGILKCFYIKNNEVCEQEVLYIHLQKRTMQIETENLNSYLIVPNKFIESQKINKDLILQFSKNKFYFDYYKKRIKSTFQKLKQGYISQKIFKIKQKRKLKKLYGKEINL